MAGNLEVQPGSTSLTLAVSNTRTRPHPSPHLPTPCPHLRSWYCAPPSSPGSTSLTLAVSDTCTFAHRSGTRSMCTAALPGSGAKAKLETVWVVTADWASVVVTAGAQVSSRGVEGWGLRSVGGGEGAGAGLQSGSLRVWHAVVGTISTSHQHQSRQDRASRNQDLVPKWQQILHLTITDTAQSAVAFKQDAHAHSHLPVSMTHMHIPCASHTSTPACHHSHTLPHTSTLACERDIRQQGQRRVPAMQAQPRMHQQRHAGAGGGAFGLNVEA